VNRYNIFYSIFWCRH